MSFLSWLNKAEDWLIRKTLQPPIEPHPAIDSDKYDVPLTLMLTIVLFLLIAATCGHYLAK